MLLLSISLSAQTTLYLDNMESVGYTWRGVPKVGINTGYISGVSNATDVPANTNLYSSSITSYRIFGSGLGSSSVERDTLVYSLVSLDPLYCHEFRLRVSSIGIQPSTNTAAGVDGSDYVEVNYTLNGTNYIKEIRLVGISNSTWDYNNAGVVSKSSNNTLTNFTGPASRVSLFLPAGATQIGFQIITSLNANGESFLIDDVELIKCSSALPITLIDFKAKQVGRSIKLEWSTATETNNDYFSILRSLHGLEYWYLVNSIPGAGNSNQTKQYTLYDQNPTNGINYYVLTQTDYDGTRVQYGPIAIQFTTIPEYDIWEHYNILGQEIK